MYNHKDNEEYIRLQSEKSNDPKRQEVWAKRYEKHVNKFMARFKHLEIVGVKDIITLGARFGGEVEAFRRLGHNCVGIDIVPHPDRGVIYGDFHNIPFKNKSFDLVYSNSCDHSNNVPRFISEAIRVLRNDGLLVLDIMFGMTSKYEENEFESPEEVRAMIESVNMKYLSSEIIGGAGKLYPKGKEVQLRFQK